MPDRDVASSDVQQTARNIVLRQLSAAPKTRYQLKEKLAAREIPADIAEEVLDRFEEVELIDDAEFAQLWVRSRHRSKGLARRALSMELKKLGVDEMYIHAALDQVTAEDEWHMAYELVEKRLSRSARGASRAGDQKQHDRHDRMVRRLVGFLSRKGYAPGLAFSIVADVMNADDLDDPDE